MRCKPMLILAVSTALLGACNRASTEAEANGTANTASGNDSGAPANAAGEAAKPESTVTAASGATTGGSGGLDRAYLVGRWSDDGDCSAATEFRADGTFLFPWGDTGQWTLAGDQLTLTGNTHPFTIRVIDANTLERTAAGGTPRRVTRCT